MRQDLYVDAVLKKCDALKRAGLWAAEPKVRPKAWLGNFERDEQLTAAVLLDHFVYYSATCVDRLLATGFRNLRDELVAEHGYTEAGKLLERAVFTRVESETPNPTDSGNLFCRKARQILSIPERRVMEPREALYAASEGEPVIFVDDFLGSGDQFINTWTSDYYNKAPHSFEKALVSKPFLPIYLVLLASEKGLGRVKADAPQVKITATHVVTNDYSVKNISKKLLLPTVPDLEQRIEQLIAKYAPKLVVPSYMNQQKWRSLGYHELGFLIAFDHSTPDASLPILWADESSEASEWTPLVKRT